MTFTDINNEDWLVEKMCGEHLRDRLFPRLTVGEIAA